MTDDTSPTTANSAMKADSPTIIDDSNPDNWWKQAVIYQIYPRSFADENGDGLGDLAGITKHMDYLEKLGVDALWLSSFYPSQLADGGYDVDDYRAVDPPAGNHGRFRLHGGGRPQPGAQDHGGHSPQPFLQPSPLVSGGLGGRTRLP